MTAAYLIADNFFQRPNAIQTAQRYFFAVLTASAAILKYKAQSVTKRFVYFDRAELLKKSKAAATCTFAKTWVTNS
jgi:hypothetical protein